MDLYEIVDHRVLQEHDASHAQQEEPDERCDGHVEDGFRFCLAANHSCRVFGNVKIGDRAEKGEGDERPDYNPEHLYSHPVYNVAICKQSVALLEEHGERRNDERFSSKQGSSCIR